VVSRSNLHSQVAGTTDMKNVSGDSLTDRKRQKPRH